MKKIIRLTENDLDKLVKKVLVEQKKNLQVNQTAKQRFDELSKKISEGFCVPVSNQGNLTQIACQDGHYWQMYQYRKFGEN